ncbi:crossover junction endodeoxyribonuclease RuvC [Maridesulfovibrio hydrothermalis]|uniref:Crossover junction endodeoxyribonuclease RuvC n=1 Tax=Maridesulfovibrio hydrothermalis AM13 = DSM 14728 TaxID=1121451 RepID=L0RGL9_9BACT|nr:crossover junction endodeoxyribonuclease RuvC [Maridesulfovibrio hydrothermalis]CCO25377.1 component of RuvABC resolvasome, endonuclease [Maridesulfovibrio hydrothermalis AM13 = DSM 14728]
MGDSGIVIIGIDPGTRVTGFGIVRELSGQVSLVDAGTIRTDSKKPMCARLGQIYARIAGLLASHSPDEAAIENIFVASNSASALKLGQARGAAMAACAVSGIIVSGYEPTKVKLNLVGNGRADKSQVAFMVERILGVKNTKWALDTTDALAIAICHLNERRFARMAGK